ncbi:DNA repair protein RecO [Halosquirtibacter laminarini]|uniref:DNA repair protein RecO n=1 Tax=Halosquirtibacter laminarini TaxID=3374600 RepID=A0AC61NQZ9_9BACT|nr:DNA repair protein RecO [Prolixibacteraceae bacterium]
MEPIRTSAIVLGCNDYTTSKKIVKLLTPNFGKIECIVTGVSSKKGKIKRAYLQPSFNLECIVEKKNESKALYTLKEFHIKENYYTIPYDVLKSSQVFFLCEAIQKLTVEDTQQQLLYEFVSNAFQMLDVSDKGAENFHIIFLFELLKIQGYPLSNNEIPLYKTKDIDYKELNIEDLNFNKITTLNWNRNIRNQWIELILRHIEITLNIRFRMKSLSILKQIFD